MHKDLEVTQYLVTAVRTQEKACCSDSRFRRKLRGTTGHRLLGTQRPQMSCVAAWVWFCLYTEFVAANSLGRPISSSPGTFELAAAALAHRIISTRVAKTPAASTAGAPALGNTGGGSVASGNTGGGSVASGNTGGESVAPGNTGGGSIAPGNTGGGSVASGNTGGGGVAPGNTGGGGAQPAASSEESFGAPSCRVQCFPRTLEGRLTAALHAQGVSNRRPMILPATAYSKGFALTWYRALTWYSSPARPFAAPDDPLFVTGQ